MRSRSTCPQRRAMAPLARSERTDTSSGWMPKRGPSAAVAARSSWVRCAGVTEHQVPDGLR